MSGLGELGEFGLIQRWTRDTAASGNVALGIGDDCAVVRVGDRELLITSDASVENVHFNFRWCTHEDVGWRAMSGAISDIAAMGGRSLYATISIALPDSIALADADALYNGLRAAACACDTQIIGGDTTRSPQHIFIDITVIGEVCAGRHVPRSGACAGDLLCVTGWPGRSAAALGAFLKVGRSAQLSPEIASAHLRPTPRIAAGQWLARNPAIHAMIDVSDGIVQDARHLVERSGVGLEIDLDLSVDDPALRETCAVYGLDLRACYWSGGEDYELLVAVAPEDYSEFSSNFERELGLPLRKVGVFTQPGAALHIIGELPREGFDHFRSR